MWRLFHKDADGTLHAFYLNISPNLDPRVEVSEEQEEIERLGYTLACPVTIAQRAGFLVDEEHRNAWMNGELGDFDLSLAVLVHGDPGDDFDGSIWEYDDEGGFYTLSRPETYQDQPATDLLLDYIDRVETAVVERIDQAVTQVIQMMVRLEGRLDRSQQLPEGGSPPEASKRDQDLPDQEVYTAEEFGKRVGRRRWTISQRCNQGRLLGKKLPSGEWKLPHQELLRFRREGLLPKRKR